LALILPARLKDEIMREVVKGIRPNPAAENSQDVQGQSKSPRQLSNPTSECSCNRRAASPTRQIAVLHVLGQVLSRVHWTDIVESVRASVGERFDMTHVIVSARFGSRPWLAISALVFPSKPTVGWISDFE
jgi:hypothetical protein